MSKKISYGVGSHEPIFHRLRTGNSTAEEWQRWEREVSDENLDLLEELGVSTVHIACSKGFGLEFEKPIIERAAAFAEKANKRGIVVGAYVQGFPVYYEEFLREVPEAVNWLARDQSGDFIPWGAHTFRRWIDPTRGGFLEYQYKLYDYILEQFTPTYFSLDNTTLAPVYGESAVASFKEFLKGRYNESEITKEFGISSFDAVDLPHFDPVYWPQDAYRIVKDPLLQEWAYWRSTITSDFVSSLRAHIKSTIPEMKLIRHCGCEGLRYSQLFSRGVDFEQFIDSVDNTGMEESSWRPGVIEVADEGSLKISMDERTAGDGVVEEKVSLRVSTNSRFGKILQNYGMGSQHSFWGEHDRLSKLIALSHEFTFSKNANDIGSIGPLAAHKSMIDDIKDVIEWGNAHIEALAGRGDRVAPIAVWRSTSTISFIRHQPAWEACVTEQMLYENHVPFTILFDRGLENFLENRKVLILPGASCVSDKQVDLITAFVEKGGRLLLLGESGTRDERTRVRTKYAFSHFFGADMPDLELIGPPHWVPELDFSNMPDLLTSDYGKGKVIMVKSITPAHEHDISRDSYMPERQVMVKDIIPPANEDAIMTQLNNLYTEDELRVTAPRWSICEFWERGNDLLVCCVNLRKGRDGGPVTISLGKYTAEEVDVHLLLEDKVLKLPVTDGKVVIETLEHFCAVVVRDVV